MGRHIITKQMAQDAKVQKSIDSAPKSHFVKISRKSLDSKRISVYSYMVK